MQNEWIATAMNWLWRVSWQAGVLVLLVLVAQCIFRAKLAPKWRYALWLLVLGRLLLPASFQSAMSIFNYANAERITRFAPTNAAQNPSPQIASQIERTDFSDTALVKTQFQNESENFSAVAQSQKQANAPEMIHSRKPHRAWPWKPTLFFGWLFGVCVLAARLMWGNISFARRLRGKIPVQDPRVLSPLRECESLMNIRRKIPVIETSDVQSPALFGCFRPKLLLPERIAETFSNGELRCIFLHELAHIRRADLLVNWLAAILQILHWFNPLIWLGFHRMRADRELACDALALSRAGDGENRFYGETILKLLENLSRPASVPGLVGILENKNEMKQRIKMIAAFKKVTRWPVLAMLILVVLAAITLTDAQTKSAKKSETTEKAQSSVALGDNDFEENIPGPRPDLVGQIQNTNGEPIVATVFISTAGPKVGTSPFCPSCYADCRKSAKSDANGNFKIESLNPQLRFRILVVAKNYRPKFVGKIDPAKGPITVKLKPANLSDARPENSVRGRVVNPKGEPIIGAVVESHGIHQKDGHSRWGSLPGVDPLAVTDERGEFLITSKNPFQSLDLKVQARMFANKTFTELAAGRPHDLVMTEGATVTGRVMFSGKPLKNASVGMVSVDRGMEHFTGNFEVGTTADGQFAFVNLPPDVDYYIYGIMKTLKPYGAIGTVKVHSGGDGETTDVGDLKVEPGFRLAGRVVLADGKPLPKKTRLLVSRENAWDSMQLTLDKNGGFDTTGIPRESLSLSTQIPGYRISGQNVNLDRLNPFQIVGRVNQDTTNLVLLFEKGKNLPSDYNSIQHENELPQNLPLRGAEAANDHSNQYAISGRVLDSETKEPIANARITPGQPDWRIGVDWNPQRVQNATNGAYRIYVNKTSVEVKLKAEADGYLPAASPTLSPDKTNFDFVLKKGSGPHGTVLLPDGKPAAKISVALICPPEQPYSLRDGKIDFWQNEKLVKATDANGNFSFPPELEMQSIIAAGLDGIKGVSIQTLAANPKIILEPYGKITGTLQRKSGPGTNEDLDISFAEESFPGQLRLNPGTHTMTDEKGRFVFNRVPPGELQITYRQKVSENGWQNLPLQNVTLKPGETLNLEIEAADRPPVQISQPVAAKPKPIRQPGLGPKGIVLTPDGKPAINAEVALIVPNEYFGLGKATFSSAFQARKDGLIVLTDANGKFALPSGDDATAVIALSPDGYAEVSLEGAKSGKIQLQKWGRVEGTLKIGQRLGTNERLFLSEIDFPNHHPMYGNEFRTLTDDSGHFSFSYVPPGKRKIVRMIPISNSPGSYNYGNPTFVDVKSGITTEITIGGNGRKISGKLISKTESPLFAWSKLKGFIRTPMPEPEKPAVTPEEQKAWQNSPVYKKARRSFRIYQVAMDANGYFHADDVLSGKYRMEIWSDKGKAFLPKEIVIPEITDANRNEPLDLGTLELEANPKAQQ